MRRTRWWVPVLLVGLWLAVTVAAGAVRLPDLFDDNMVLQRGRPIPVWGVAEPGEQVTVTLAGQQAVVQADAGGKWLVRLPAMAAGGPYELKAYGTNSGETLTNVAVGEVWVCSGQSNMEWQVKNSVHAEEEIAAARYPQIRSFTVTKAVAVEPLPECDGRWEVCSPRTVGNFTAVGYFFARELHRALGVPVGIINTSWGGTPAESWTSLAALQADAALQPIVTGREQWLSNYAAGVLAREQRVHEWMATAQAAQQAGKLLPLPPALEYPDDPRKNAWLPSGLYNGMIAPLLPYGIAGAIWYQGESNAGRAYQYRTLFPTMIRDWRQAWGQGDFPFLFVQLANFMGTPAEPAESAWAELREAQLMTLSLPATGMATIIDIGDAQDIHPRNKQDVGSRLALAAQAIAYGRRLVYSGPIYRSMTVEGDQVRLRFAHTGGRLVAKGGPLRGFAVAGEDRQFHWAEAKIEGGMVTVRSAQVARPVAVRYAWADNPACNLYNQAGLPASPFRTDDWPGVTAGK